MTSAFQASTRPGTATPATTSTTSEPARLVSPYQQYSPQHNGMQVTLLQFPVLALSCSAAACVHLQKKLNNTEAPSLHTGNRRVGAASLMPTAPYSKQSGCS